VFEHVDSDVHADSRDSEEMALRTAEKLLKVVFLFYDHFWKKVNAYIYNLGAETKARSATDEL
jgi:hypothetical protein